jgi:hypothetical protein
MEAASISVVVISLTAAGRAQLVAASAAVADNVADFIVRGDLCIFV